MIGPWSGFCRHDRGRGWRDVTPRLAGRIDGVSVTHHRRRKTALAQGIVALWFNVAVLALLINIAADAIRG